MGSKGQKIDSSGTWPLFPEEDVAAYKAVMYGADDEHCKMPTGANVVPAGIVQEAVTLASGLPANVARKGTLRCIGKGTGDPGDAVVIATSAGDVETVDTLNPADKDVIHVLGYLIETMVDGKRVHVEMNIHDYVHGE